VNDTLDGPLASDRSSRWCIVGAGPAGLTTAKNFQDLGIPFDVLERDQALGGIWRYNEPGSSVYRSTCMISSKRMTAFRGFPVPEHTQDYMRHDEGLAYLVAYARHHGLADQIEFDREVTKAYRTEHCWIVELADGEWRRYRGLVIATGHHWDPRSPRYRGTFSGRILHSAEYRTPALLQDKRVLVVGTGNSGSDIAVESSRTASATFHSIRSGCYYLPKFFLGRPMDEVMEIPVRWHAPRWTHRLVRRVAIRAVFGDPSRLGLPRPTHRIMEGRLILNSDLVHCVAHGWITPKPDVEELLGDRVRFSDGSEEEIDVIIHATGFHLSIPFVDPGELRVRGPNQNPDFRLHVFHPERDDIFIIGMIQPDSGAWWLFDDQAKAVARYIRACETGEAGALRARRAVDRRSHVVYQPSGVAGPHSSMRVDHNRYEVLLRRLRRDLESAMTSRRVGRGHGKESDDWREESRDQRDPG